MIVTARSHLLGLQRQPLSYVLTSHLILTVPCKVRYFKDEKTVFEEDGRLPKTTQP